MTLLDSLRHLRETARGQGSDDGFSLVELMTAMAVFGLLMALVSAAMISGFSGIKTTMAKSEVQQQNQLAAEWMSRALSYAEVPEGVTPATPIDAATTNSITFYTNASLGTRAKIPYNEAPYKVTLSVDNSSSTTKTYVLAKQIAPLRSASGWTWTDAAAYTVTRKILTLPKTGTSPLSVTVHSCDPTIGCAASDLNVTLPMTSSTIAAPRVPNYVQFTIGDPADTRNVISRRVRLVNLA